MLDLRFDHGAQRRLLQVQQLRHDVRLRVSAARRCRRQRRGRLSAGVEG